MVMPRQLKRFLRQFFHPGTWILFSLLAVVAGIFLPFASPALMIFAAVAIGIAALTFIPYVVSYFDNLSSSPISFFLPANKSCLDNFGNHPAQIAIVGIGICLFIVALTLTIGFFTGGAGFAFMAPVFAALAAPFAAAGASAGISLALSALAGTVLVLGVLNLTNTLKRFVAWLDSFKYDHATTVHPEEHDPKNWEALRYKLAERALVQHNYPEVVFKGMWATIKNGFTSPDEDKLEEEKPTIYNG